MPSKCITSPLDGIPYSQATSGMADMRISRPSFLNDNGMQMAYA